MVSLIRPAKLANGNDAQSRQEMDTSMTFPRITTISYTLLILFAAIIAVKFWGFIEEDSFITLRYARNLANTGIPSWNLGEAPVEGYTSLLHMVLNAGTIALGLDAVVGTRIIGALGVILAILGATFTFRSLKLPQGAQIAGFATLLSPPLIAWIWGGLEGPLVVGLISLGLLGTVRALHPSAGLAPAFWASLAFGFAYLARPEAAVANFAAGLGLLLFAPFSLSERLKRFIAIGTISVLVLLCHLAFRYSYYGEVAPLTYYAKVGGLPAGVLMTNGLDYLLNSLISLPFVVAAILAAVAAIWMKKASPAIYLGLLVIAVQIATVTRLGGDLMFYARLLLPVLPAAALLMAGALSALPEKRVGLAGLAIAVVMGLQIPSLQLDRAASEVARRGSVFGTYMNERFRDPMLIAAATAGAAPFHGTRHAFIDTLGLNDPIIAQRQNVPMRAAGQFWPGHSKGDGEYVLSRKPDIIIIGPVEGVPLQYAQEWFLTGVELRELRGFIDCYEETVEQVDPSELDVWSARYFDHEIRFVYYRRVCS